MESAPLTRAHDHAREASLATNMADTVVAVNEHVLAAGEFAAAAHDTSSIEALRTLHLLEQHHQRLARLLQYSLEHPPAAEQQEKVQTDTGSLKEKDVAAAAGEGGDANETGKAGTSRTITTTASKATATPASVSGIVSRGEFSNASTARSGAGTAVAAGHTDAFLGGDGAASSVRQAPGDKNGSFSAATAAVSAAVNAQQAGAAAMANVLSQQPQQQRRHPPSRELSSSIATNLASARGIRSSRYHRGQPAAPSMSTDQAPGSLDGQAPKAGGSRAQMQSVLQQQKQQKKQQQQLGGAGVPSWVPPQHPQRVDAAEEDALVGQAENGDGGGGSSSEGFARFYDRFGSFINRLSAPLAFAGLPLITEEAGASDADASEQTVGQSKSGFAQRRGRAPSSSSATAGASRSSSAAPEPDLSQIYSKAALRAINRDGLGGNANDSFYVVPKTGHTASYANILSFEQKEQRRRLAASAVLVHGTRDEGAPDELGDGDGDDDYEHGFADARKQAWERDSARPARSGLMQRLAAADPSRSRNSGGSSTNSNSANKHLVEELTTENESLKDMLDRLSRRLHAFEASAQQSHMALQESMRFMQPGSAGDAGAVASEEAPLPTGAGGVPDATAVNTLALKNRNLETELARLAQRLDASERERAHQEKTLQKYRDKWEKLKAGAKARREAQGGGGESSR